LKNISLLPSLVISIGPFAQKISQQASLIYLASNPKRRQVTQFLALGTGEKSPYDLKPLALSDNDENQIAFPKPGSAGERQAFIENLIKSAEQIRSTMASITHQLRAHENLIKIDLDQRLEKSFNQFIIADLVDPMAAAALLPLSFLLQDISHSQAHTHSHLLLNAAILPDKCDINIQDEAALFNSLQELDQALTDVTDQKYRNLLRSMGIRQVMPLSFPVYLFDYRKPNYNNVKDVAELQRIFANSLIGLMSGNMTEIVDHNRPWGYIQKQHAYYQSIGSANLVYEPRSLIQACSNFMARKVIDEGILASNTNNSLISDLHQQASSQLGTLKEWYGILLTGTLYNMAVNEDKTPCVADELPGVSLQPINFEKVHETPWVEDVREYISKFESVFLAETFNIFEERSSILVEQNLDKLLAFLATQIENPALYPDAINALRQILHQIEQCLEQSKNDLLERKKDLENQLTPIEIDGQLHTIQSILDKAPRLPGWWRHIPEVFRKPLSLLVNLKWIARYHFQLKREKKHLKERLAIHHSAIIEDRLINELLAVLENFAKDRDLFLEKLQKFENTVIATKSQFLESWDGFEFPLGEEDLSWDETFRCPVINRNFAQWAYEKFEPMPTSAAAQYIKDDNLLEDWESIDPSILKERLVKSCQRAFMPLTDININQVLERRVSLMMNAAGDPDKVEFDPVSPLLRAALPLMQPNFDALGGSGYSTRKLFLQAEDRQSQFIDPVLNNNERMNFIQTDDPCIISAVSIQDLMPLAAFTALNEHLKQAYERIAEPQRKKLENVFVPIPRLEGEDLEEKVFTWEFGSPPETLQIALPISHKRFRHAQQEKRLPLQEWVNYVVAESPELNYLAACFLNIFLQHPDWNGFEQTSAILAFVQQGITYAYDKDTTPQTEWPRYPIETLQEGVGDCEDVAILTAALMNRLGFQVALLQLPGHCALGIAGVDNFPGAHVTDSKSGRRYYYAEATGDGWQIGVIPENDKDKNVEIYPVERLIEK
jgi:predicted transglutaminase-like cysteine proteinase